MSRSAVILALALAAAPVRLVVSQSAAPDSLDLKSATLIRAHYLSDMDTVHAKVVALAKAIPADKYSWRPGAGVRSVSEVLMHIVGEWYYYGPLSVGGKSPADFLKTGQKTGERLAELEKTTDKAQVLAALDKSWAYNKQQMEQADVSKMLGKYKPWGLYMIDATLGMTGDQHEHLGQLIAYARSVGVKPPWSK